MHEIFFLSNILFTSCYFMCTCLVLEISLFGSIVVKHRSKSFSYLAFRSIYNTIQYNAIQYNTIQYNTIQYNTIQYILFQLRSLIIISAVQYNNTEWRHMFIKQDNSNYLNDNMLQQVGCAWQHDPRRGKE